MKKNILFVLIVVLATQSTNAKIINIPTDYPTIQQGIDVAFKGDTIMVAPGVYNENLSFNGKKIVIASIFLISNDPADISITIIDGQQKGSVVIFESGEDSNSVLCGFTIRNGYATRGGGIYCQKSEPKLRNLIIEQNKAESAGGGIALDLYSHSKIEDVIIQNNLSNNSGGGISISESKPSLANVTIRKNRAVKNGGGLSYNMYSPETPPLIFDTNRRCNIYFNRAGTSGNDIDRGIFSNIQVAVDTFTVANPTNYHLSPSTAGSVDILHAKVEQVKSDLYVSPLGSDDNDGLTPENPVQTIFMAMTKMITSENSPRIVYLGAGEYSPSATGEIFPLNFQSYVTLSGASREQVILNAEFTNTVLLFESVKVIKIENMIIKNGQGIQGGGIYCEGQQLKFENIILKNNISSRGGGLYAEDSDLQLTNILVNNNRVGDNGEGGGLGLRRCEAVLTDVQIKNNYSARGGGVDFFNSNTTMANVTISNNIATSRGGGIYITNSCKVLFNNSEKCNIFLNTAPHGSDIYSTASDIYTVIVDTFTVKNPTNYHADPMKNFKFDILNAKLQQSSADLYVSPMGNDLNSGISFSEPLQTITHALTKILADSVNPRTIHLAEGIYSSSATGEKFPIGMMSYVSLSGENQGNVILDAEGVSSVVVLDQVEAVNIRNLTITGGYLSYGGTSVRLLPSGGGISCYSSDLTLENVTLRKNFAMFGGGIDILFSRSYLKNVIISENTANFGGGISLRMNREECFFENVTINDNHTFKAKDGKGNVGGGIYFDRCKHTFFSDHNRCSIYNNKALTGYDVSMSTPIDTIIEIKVDTFTVMQPTEVMAYPLEAFAFDINHSMVKQILGDVYISPNGNDLNSGLSAAEPLKTFMNARARIFADSLNPCTIHLANGVYSPSTTGETFPIRTFDFLSFQGESKQGVVLNAEQKGRVFFVSEDKSISIENMTITGGSESGIFCSDSHLKIKNADISKNKSFGTFGGGGIYCQISVLSLENVVVDSNDANDGGGIYLNNATINTKNVTIIGNNAYSGGGILCRNCNLVLSDLTLFGNTATEGGGIHFDYCNAQLQDVKIVHNRAQKGGGISFDNSQADFHTTKLCNIYANKAGLGSDLFSDDINQIAVTVDTFTVANPTNYHAFNRKNYAFNILNSKIEQVKADLYLSPAGDDNNRGFSATEPLKTISSALIRILADSTEKRTLHLAPGVYSPSKTGEIFPINILNYISLRGDSDQTVLDAERTGNILYFYEVDKSYISNVILKNGNTYWDGGCVYCYKSAPHFEYLSMNNNSSSNGGAVHCVQSKPFFRYVKIHDNNAEYGGAFLFEDSSDCKLEQVEIVNNWAERSGGGICCWKNSQLELTNVIISNNRCVLGAGGGLAASDYSNAIIINSTIFNNRDNYSGALYLEKTEAVLINLILWQNAPYQIMLSNASTINIAYSNIKGGKEKIIKTGGWSDINWLDGNLDAEPVFEDVRNYNFRLSDSSLCIGSGMDSIQIDGKWYYAPPADYEGTARPTPVGSKPDLGAFENKLGSPNISGVADNAGTPLTFHLLQNYPNPFNPITTIGFTIPKTSFVELKIYNSLGQEISTIVSQNLPAGNYFYHWNGYRYASGLYFYRLKTDKYESTKKLVILR